MKQEPFFPEADQGKSLMERVEEGLLPLINVVFLLLMFFLIAGIILRDELPPLPDSQASDDGDRPRLDLVITADGTLRFQGQATQSQELANLLPEFQPDRRLRVGAHEALSMGDLERHFETLAEAGHPEVILLTDQRP